MILKQCLNSCNNLLSYSFLPCGITADPVSLTKSPVDTVTLGTDAMLCPDVNAAEKRVKIYQGMVITSEQKRAAEEGKV